VLNFPLFSHNKDVDIVATYELFNINRTNLEHIFSISFSTPQS